jgi:hypothetical protein
MNRIVLSGDLIVIVILIQIQLLTIVLWCKKLTDKK